MRKWFALLFILHISTVFSAPYNGHIFPFKQPDGTSVDVKLFGSEYYMRAEGLDSYTLIREPESGWICYARLTDDQMSLESTGIIYRGTKDNPASLRNNLNLPPHLEIKTEARQKIINDNQKLLKGEVSVESIKKENRATITDGTPIHPVSGNILGLCVVVDFPDEPGSLPMSEFEDFCNDINYSNFGNNGSLRTFYSDISGGLVDYQNVVYGYYHAPHTFAYYDSLPFSVGAKQVLNLALNWIQSQGFDFSTLSLNPDNSIMAINLMYTGNPPSWSQGMWYHQGNFTGFSANGVHTNSYNCSPANSPLAIGVVAHENGHMIGGWPDTYKYDNTTGPDGIGTFDLMCSYGDAYNPVPPNPFFRSNAGWGQVVDVTNFNGLNYDTVSSLTCYRYNNLNDTNEFFLLENRMATGRSFIIPDEGLTIWHIDRNGDNQTFHHEVFLEHANNNLIDESMACFSAPLYTDFNLSTIPNSNWYNGDPSGLKVWEVGFPDSILSYRLGSGFPGPALNIQYQNISNDNNGNGFIEAGETADVNVNSLNTGLFNSSANTMISCTAVGINAGLVTVNTAPVNLNVINSLQTIPVTFSITIAPTAPIGTVFSLRFELTDSSDTAVVTKTIIVGEQVIMDNSNSTTCNAVFYDSGFLNNYSDDQDFEKTIFPVSAGNVISVKFTYFGLEDEATCDYDYLKIYNGPTTASPLIGKYCGLNSPDSVVSTHLSGALTFQFHSDGGVTGPGWEAEINCIAVLGIEEMSRNSISVFPNPSDGIFHLTGNSIEEYCVYNVYGQLIERSGDIKSNVVEIDLSGQSAGIYFLKFISFGREFSRRIVLN